MPVILGAGVWSTYKDLIALAVTSLIAVVALLVTWAQARNGRLLDLHEKITTGELSDARHRLATHLYEKDRPLAARIVWADLQGYQGDHPCPRCHVTLDDAFSLLWYFQRLNRAVGSRVIGAVTGYVPYRAARDMLGWHAVWWAIAFGDVTVQDARFATDLQALARKIDPHGAIRASALQRFEPAGGPS